jgi:hypothetical protein
MSETTKDTDKKKKPLSLSRPGRLELNKTVEQDSAELLPWAFQGRHGGSA